SRPTSGSRSAPRSTSASTCGSPSERRPASQGTRPASAGVESSRGCAAAWDFRLTALGGRRANFGCGVVGWLPTMPPMRYSGLLLLLVGCATAGGESPVDGHAQPDAAVQSIDA